LGSGCPDCGWVAYAVVVRLPRRELAVVPFPVAGPGAAFDAEARAAQLMKPPAEPTPAGGHHGVMVMPPEIREQFSERLGLGRRLLSP
jgi:hypothetical protein